jgi:hypothetical protein
MILEHQVCKLYLAVYVQFIVYFVLELNLCVGGY